MISNLMTHDHRDCDESFAQAEEAAVNGDLDTCKQVFQDFHQHIERHFAAEEAILFPQLQSVSMDTGQPITVMCSEHQQILSLITEMDMHLQAQDFESFLDGCETLLILMQQHNMKEENILYPIADQALSDEVTSMAESLQKAIAA